MPRVGVVLFFVFVFCAAGVGFAEVKDTGFENQHVLRISVRSDDDDYNFYLTRATAFLEYNLAPLERSIRISPFVEYQHELDSNTWWRKETGAEIGTSFLNEQFYYGASFQHVWQQEENYTVEALDETTEWESRFVIMPRLNWWVFGEKVKLRVFNEYTYDFSRGQGTISEVGGAVDWQLREDLKVPIGWRHTDRVHDFDSDTLELGALLSF